MRLDQVGYAMSDDTGLAAPRTCKEKQGTFDVLNRFALLRVKTCKEIHEKRQESDFRITSEFGTSYSQAPVR
jgi:hypothetical protein